MLCLLCVSEANLKLLLVINIFFISCQCLNGFSLLCVSEADLKLLSALHIFLHLVNAWMDLVQIFREASQSYLSSKAKGCQWVCLFVCSLTPPKRLTLMSWNFEGWFPWGADGKAKKLRFGKPFAVKLARQWRPLVYVNCSHYVCHFCYVCLKQIWNYS